MFNYPDSQLDNVLDKQTDQISLINESPTLETSESIATLPPFGPIEGHRWFFQIFSQWESQKNQLAFISFGKIQFLPPIIWDVPFMSYRWESYTKKFMTTRQWRDWHDRTTFPGQPWQNNEDRKVDTPRDRTTKSGQDIQDKKVINRTALKR